MKYVIYIDVFFCVNLVMDFLILKLVSLYIKPQTTYIRCVLGAALGSFLSVLSLLISYENIIWHMLFSYIFIAVAMVEEGFKWLVLLAFTKKNKHYNSLFDGIIYSVFISLGFAGFENLLYTFKFGMETALIRMLTAVPIHLFCGVSMGYYLTWYYIKNNAKLSERRLAEIGAVPKKMKHLPARRFFFMSVIMPSLAHGFYNYSYSINKACSTAVFCVFLAFLYGFCMGRVKRMSNGDMLNYKAVLLILYEKHTCVQNAVKSILEARRETGEDDHDICFDEIFETVKKSSV